MLVVAAVILIIFKIFLAKKDASSYLLKEKDEENELTHKRIKRWHRDGVIIDLIFTSVLAWAVKDYIHVAVQSLLVRLTVYDVAFNYCAKLDYKHLGSTAWADQIFSKYFGQDGAVKKAIFFLIVLVIYTLLAQIM